jgi:hypothetical protein
VVERLSSKCETLGSNQNQKEPQHIRRCCLYSKDVRILQHITIMVYFFMINFHIQFFSHYRNKATKFILVTVTMGSIKLHHHGIVNSSDHKMVLPSDVPVPVNEGHNPFLPV